MEKELIELINIFTNSNEEVQNNPNQVFLLFFAMTMLKLEYMEQTQKLQFEVLSNKIEILSNNLLLR